MSLKGRIILTQFSKKVKLSFLSTKLVLFIGIGVNLGLIGYFKYADFFITNINSILNSNIALLNVFLPLAISFYTFQQISYLVDILH